jgi:HEAT repeat protein
VLRSNYVVVLVDCNDRNNHLTTHYHAEQMGLPSIVILDSAGKYLTTKNTEELEEGGGHSPEKVLAFLNEWTPRTVNAISVKQWVEKFLETDSNAEAKIEFQRIRDRSSEALPYLIEMIQTTSSGSATHEHRRIRAYGALQRLGPAAKPAVPALAALMTTNTPQNVRGFIRSVLVRLGSDAKEAIPVLREAFHSSDLAMQIDAGATLARLNPTNEELLPKALKWLQSPDDYTRRGASFLLQELGAAAKPAMAALTKALTDPDDTVRSRATNTLAKIRQ